MDTNSKVDSAKTCFAQVCDFCKTLLPKMCGNRMKAYITSLCEEEGDVTYRTVIYADGTLILNEKSSDIESNIAKHGEAKFVYDSMLEDGSNYIFDLENPAYWCADDEARLSITSIEVGSTMRPTSTAYWFKDTDNVKSVDLTNLRTHNVTDMSYMFSGCGTSAEPLDLTMLNVSKVENFTQTFANSDFDSIDFSEWDTSSAVDMSAMFTSCKTKNLDLTDFDTENVVYMGSMFANCHTLESVDVSSFDTSNCEYMVRMFGGCESLESLDITNFDTRKVTSISEMFYGCETLTELDMSHFRTNSVVGDGMTSVFDSCRNLKSLDLSSFNTRQVSGMAYMFSECESLESVDLSSFDTSSLETAERMFYGCQSLTELDLSRFEATSGEFNCTGMFSNCAELETIYVTDFIYDPDTWSDEPWDEEDTEWQMFHGCQSLVGGAGTTYDASRQTCQYAILDGGTSNPGYFTAI